MNRNDSMFLLDWIDIKAALRNKIQMKTIGYKLSSSVWKQIWKHVRIKHIDVAK